jgi:hypothetical protein
VVGGVDYILVLPFFYRYVQRPSLTCTCGKCRNKIKNIPIVYASEII